jgi:acetylornithine deacetylase/succinyl-diaminopimelate desuccinylase-like protein
MQAGFTQRQVLPVTTLDQGLVTTVEEAARQTGERYRVMHSGAAHDTMCVAPLVPSAMLFVPCKDGVSHSPLEDASPADAALATEIVLNAVCAWHPS